jgi:hypothetical protein
LVHQGDKSTVVSRFEQVNHFMENDVFETFEGLFGKFEIEPDGFGFGAAAAPLGFHLSDPKVFYRNAEVLFPFGYQRGNCRFKLLPIGCLKDFIFFIEIGSWSNLEHHLSMLEFELGDGVFFDDVEQVALAPEIVAFPIEVFTRGFALLVA